MCANIIKISRNKIILCYIFGTKLRVLIYTSYSENSATFFKIFFIHDRFVNLIVIIKRAKWRERDISHTVCNDNFHEKRTIVPWSWNANKPCSSIEPFPSFASFLQSVSSHTCASSLVHTRALCRICRAPWHWEKLLRAPLTFTSYDYQDTHFQVSDYSSSTPNDIH